MSKRKRSTPDQITDEVLYCERCGISFLWTSEEQKAAAGSNTDDSRKAANSEIENAMPSTCPGCRYLLPTGGRERGTVKWYNGRKRFGFITRQNHGDLFVHGSALTDKRRLSEGDLVEFSVTETDRGLAAQEVTILQSAAQ